MTTAQKIIKYLAIAFAIFLIVVIVETIVDMGKWYTSLYSEKEDGSLETMEIVEGSTLDVSLAFSSLEIKKGEKFEIETNNEEITITNQDNKIKIEEKKKNWLSNHGSSKVILYVPEDFKFTDVKIENGAGKLDIENLMSENIKMSLGAGRTIIDNISSDAVVIETGAGELVIKNGKLNEAKIEVGVGKLEIKAEFTGNTSISTGIGANEIELLPTENDYKIEFQKGLGSITYNGKSVSDDTIIGEGSNFIKIEGGIGSIIVKSEEK